MAASDRWDRQLQGLLRSGSPSLEWRARVRVLGEPRSSPRVERLEHDVLTAPLTRGLLSHLGRPSRNGTSGGVYRYYQGHHWTLASLADLGYPRGSEEIFPLRDRVLDFWLKERYHREVKVSRPDQVGRANGVAVLRGRARRCASQQGNALWAALELGLVDARCDDLARLLQRWQWEDGGWNCDRSLEADTSSFHETYHPMLALRAYADLRHDRGARDASDRAAEVFLERKLFRRRSDDRVMQPRFLVLHYPRYWHYDLLGGLVAMARLGKIRDPRCREALEWLESVELPAGGWARSSPWGHYASRWEPYADSGDWGPARERTANPWVTADALHVLSASGRWQPGRRGKGA